jgi:hypothetical protein
MPSERAAKYIERSLAKGENQQDFVYMLDALTAYRRVFHPEQSMEIIEEITGLIMCLLMIIKTPEYISAMGSFRLLFRGIAEDQVKQLHFHNSIRPAALHVASREDVVFRPSLYFSPLATLDFDTSLYMTQEDREDWFRDNLPNWF